MKDKKERKTLSLFFSYLSDQQLHVPKEALPRVQLRHPGVAHPLGRAGEGRDVREVLRREAERHFHGSGAVLARDDPRRRGKQHGFRRSRGNDRRGLGVVLGGDAAEAGVVVRAASWGDVFEAEGEADGVEALGGGVVWKGGVERRVFFSRFSNERKKKLEKV